MVESIVEGFAAMGALPGDAVWARHLQQRVSEALSGKGTDKTPVLARLYLDAEQDLVRRPTGEWSEDNIRLKLKTAFAASAKEYPEFELLFLSREEQFIKLQNALVRAYARICRTFYGRRIIEKIVSSAFQDTKYSDLKADTEAGIAYNPLRLRTMQDCVEASAMLFERWYEASRAFLGGVPARRAFEDAYRVVEIRIGFLPAMKSLLGATPFGVLSMAKAKRLHELETETSSQARSIRAADVGLRRQAERLQATVRELEETKRKLEVTSQARSAFIEVVAHQFRTPLSSMRWNAEMLSDELSSKESVDLAHKEAIETIRGKSVYLIDTLDRVFTTLDIDTGRLVLDLKPGFLWEAVQDAHDDLKKEIALRGVAWKFDRTKEQLQEITFDRAKMTSVLKIVVGNAIDYARDDGVISVGIAPQKINGKDYQVCSVKDDGIGMSKEELEKVFDKFYRSPTSILKVADGTGLGMYIVKNVVEAHRGIVKVESAGRDKGTTVTIALPVK